MASFRDRRDAGRRIASRLTEYKDREDVVVLGLPRGGVPVACEVAKELSAPLDVYIVRKLGTPGREELAMGAIASNGARILNDDVIAALSIPKDDIERRTKQERAEIARREAAYRGDRERLSLRSKVVILVDDGLATGASMKAAVQAVQASGPKQIIVAVGTAPLETVAEFRAWDEVDDLIAAQTPAIFLGVGGSYDDFSQTTDEEVRDCLDEAYSAS